MSWLGLKFGVGVRLLSGRLLYQEWSVQENSLIFVHQGSKELTGRFWHTHWPSPTQNFQLEIFAWNYVEFCIGFIFMARTVVKLLYLLSADKFVCRNRPVILKNCFVPFAGDFIYGLWFIWIDLPLKKGGRSIFIETSIVSKSWMSVYWEIYSGNMFNWFVQVYCKENQIWKSLKYLVLK